VHSRLELRSPSNGTGWGDTWIFSGPDDRVLRECLDQLNEFVTPTPAERYDMRRGFVIDAPDRWLVAMLLFTIEPSELGKLSSETSWADAAWTAEGAIQLAEILPERLADLRADIVRRFAP
jgi:hypothetical protein